MAINSITKPLAFIVLIIFCIDSFAVESASDFNNFWEIFRAAVLANNTSHVKALTKFPLMIKGTLDEDKTILIKEADFDSAIETLLAQDTGLRKKPQTMSQFIKENKVIDDSLITKNEAVVGNFRFIKISGNWYFVSAYTE